MADGYDYADQDPINEHDLDGTTPGGIRCYDRTHSKAKCGLSTISPSWKGVATVTGYIAIGTGALSFVPGVDAIAVPLTVTATIVHDVAVVHVAYKNPTTENKVNAAFDVSLSVFLPTLSGAVASRTMSPSFAKFLIYLGGVGSTLAYPTH